MRWTTERKETHSKKNNKNETLLDLWVSLQAKSRDDLKLLQSRTWPRGSFLTKVYTLGGELLDFKETEEIPLASFIR